MRLKTLFFILLISFCGLSCEDRRTVRTYQEVSVNPEPPAMVNPHGSMMTMGSGMMSQDPAVQSMLSASVAHVGLTWATPEGWNEEKGSGMRMATFTSREDIPVTCTIVSLGGGSGGVEANVKRWLGQIALNLSDQEFEKFMSGQATITSTGNLSVRLIDFRPLYPFKDDDGQPSMMAGIVEGGEQTIFIKLTGSLRSINQNQDKFKALLSSLALTDE